MKKHISFAWHIHHNILVEPLVEPIEIRQEYICSHKPSYEVERRLRLLRPVVGDLPQEVEDAAVALTDARTAYITDVANNVAQGGDAWDTWEAWDEAQASYKEVLRQHQSEIEALHTVECPNCPWDGHTIFPRRWREK